MLAEIMLAHKTIKNEIYPYIFTSFIILLMEVRLHTKKKLIFTKYL